MLNPNPQKPGAQAKVIAALLPCLADLLDLAGNAKLAHWHIRGPQFTPLHERFGALSALCHGHADTIAERVTLAMGGTVIGTAKQVAEESRLDDYPETERGADALIVYLVTAARDVSAGLQEARGVCEDVGDADTANILQDVAASVEHCAGLIAAHVE